MSHGRARADRLLRAPRAAWLLLLAAGGLALGGCKPYRIEYHQRPSYFDSTALDETEDRVTLDDGTVLVFTPHQPRSALERASTDGSDRFVTRQEQDDGTIVLRALLPEHVLSNTLTCLRNEEYDLLWDQVLAERTRRAYELRGQGYDEFEAYFSSNRIELAATLTRMMLGLSRQESYMENVGGGAIRYRFHPRIGSQFKFKTVDVVAETDGMKLLLIR